MTTQSQYNYFGRLLIAFAILAGVTIFICGVGISALVMWVAPDVGSGVKQASIDNTRPGEAHAGIGSFLNDRPIAG